MRKFVLPFLVVSLLSFSLASQAQTTFRSTKATVIGFLEYLPKGYDKNSDKYPVVIFLHGLGERGPNTTDVTKLKNGITPIQKNGPPKHVKNGTDFPFILISPQLKSNHGNWPASYVLEVIEYCKTYLRIDERRIYITGLSLGGGGTFSAALYKPELFAAAAPVCGWGSKSKAALIAKEGLPVWGFHGDQDHTIPMSKTIDMVNAINGCKPAPRPMAKLTIYPGVKHNAWDNAYKPDHSIHNINVYDWMLSYTNVENDGNTIPIANAGSDLNVSNKSVCITGSGSDSDGSISAYTWSKISGPSATLNYSSSSKLTASNLTDGVYVFKLRVTDNKGASDSDYVKVTVKNGSVQAKGADDDTEASTEEPVVSAGSDMIITLPTTEATINGSASTTEGEIVTYAWTKVSGGNAITLTNTNSAALKVSKLTSGSHVFRLTATSNNGLAKSDDMTLTVNAASGNIAPIADAGPDRTVELPVDRITLFGTASDKDGSIVSYKWEKTAGGSCTFSNTNSLRPTVSKVEVGKYIFKLTITDSDGAVKTDEFIMNLVDNEDNNKAPIVSAGANRVVQLPAAKATLFGVASDNDGKIVSYKWTKVSGGACTFSSTTVLRPTISKFVAGEYVFKLTVTDNDGGVKSDEAVMTFVNTSSAARSAESTGTVEQEQALSSNTVENVEESSITLNSQLKEESDAIAIYDERGTQIYSGKWNAEMYSEVLNKRGLYIYQLVKNGKRLTGKVFIESSF